jgi:hypothetical protein
MRIWIDTRIKFTLPGDVHARIVMATRRREPRGPFRRFDLQ